MMQFGFILWAGETKLIGSNGRLEIEFVNLLLSLVVAHILNHLTSK